MGPGGPPTHQRGQPRSTRVARDRCSQPGDEPLGTSRALRTQARITLFSPRLPKKHGNPCPQQHDNNRCLGETWRPLSTKTDPATALWRGLGTSAHSGVLLASRENWPGHFGRGGCLLPRLAGFHLPARHGAGPPGEAPLHHGAAPARSGTCKPGWPQALHAHPAQLGKGERAWPASILRQCPRGCRSTLPVTLELW